MAISIRNSLAFLRNRREGRPRFFDAKFFTLWTAKALLFLGFGFAVAGHGTLAADPLAAASDAHPAGPAPEWKAMDYGSFFSASLEVAKGNIANKGIAIRLDPGSGGVAQGQEFFLFETDTLRAAAVWTGPGFIDWKNVAFDGTHEVHASVVGNRVFVNSDRPGWADPGGQFTERRVKGRDGLYYGPLPRAWGHWRGLFVDGSRVVLSYTVGETEVFESPTGESRQGGRGFARSFSVGPRTRALELAVAQGRLVHEASDNPQLSASIQKIKWIKSGAPLNGQAADEGDALTLVKFVGDVRQVTWSDGTSDLGVRLRISPGNDWLHFKLIYSTLEPGRNAESGVISSALAEPEDLRLHTHGGPAHYPQLSTTRVERLMDARSPFQVESITIPSDNPYHAWMRLGGFDFMKNGSRAAVCTWQGDVWTVDGLGGTLTNFTWRRIASGLFQPLGVKVVDDQIYVTCRDQITRLHDLNGDGETDFYENFNNDAQVTEHFHEFAMDLQTDTEGNFYYAKGGRHAKDALVPQHGTLIRVSKDGSQSEIVANGFRAPNGVCVNNDGTFIVSDQEGHWTPENRINWVKPGGFYGYMMGFHEGRSEDDFLPPVVWIHKSLDRSPAEQLWVTSEKWGLPRGSLISLSYGTGKILDVLAETIDGVTQGAVFALPIVSMPTGIMRGRFHPADGQLYTTGLFGWAGDKTRPGGFYRVRYLGKPLRLPIGFRATQRGIIMSFSDVLDEATAADPENYSVKRWTYKRTANYGSDDYKLSAPGERGRDVVNLVGARLSKDKRSVLLEIPDMQPSMQMEIKSNIQAGDGGKIELLIENTIHRVGSIGEFN